MDRVEVFIRKHNAVLLTDDVIMEMPKSSFPCILPALKRGAEAHGFQIRIIVYLRRQDQYLVFYWT